MAEISKIQPFGSTTQYDLTDNNAPRKDGAGATGTWGISITGNAATATALTSNAGSSTVPIYFSGGKPVQCSTTLGVSITGNSATATKATQDANGYNLSDTYMKQYIQVIDLSGNSTGTWYPATIPLPYNGLCWIGCVTMLNGGNKASWASHNTGHNSVVEVLAEASGWGTSGMWSILLIDDQRWLNSGEARPVGYSQFGNSSKACFWLRGGAKYRMKSNFHAAWTVYTSSTSVSSQTIEPTTSYPGISTTIKLMDANAYSYFNRAYGAVWNDYAEMRNVPEVNICEDNLNISNIKLAGRCVYEVGDDTMVLSTKRMQPGCKIISDTFGFNIGETDDCKTPIAVSGRVLVYIYEGRKAARQHIGQPVCSGPNGTVSIMTDEEYAAKGYCCVGTISAVPEYETWGSGNVQVDGRIWIYVK